MKGGTIDIETFKGHYRAYVDKLYETRVTEVAPETLASYSYKPYGKGKAVTVGVWDFETYDEFLKSLWQIFDENEFLIGQNIRRFDDRQSCTFFAENGLPKPRPTKFYDTMLIAKKNFKLPSYSLKYLLVRFGIGTKLETGGDELWTRVEEGDPVARKKFLRYNENDTVQTEKLFNFFCENGYVERPCSKFYVPGQGCVRCGHMELQSRGEQPRAEGWAHGFQCKNCGKRNYTAPFKSYEKVSTP